jgi:hypothetical protein
VVRFLHVPHTRHRVKIDWWGAATIVVALVPLLLVAENGRDWGWGSPLAIGCYALGVVGLISFLIVERVMGDAALIPLKLFRHPTFSMVTVLGVLVGFGMFGAMMTLPLYLQLVNGATPTESGFLLLPMILGLMISSVVSGQVISRTGRYRIFPTIGAGLMSAGFLWFTFAHADRPVWFMMVGMLLLGLGLGQSMQTLTIASQNSVGPREIGVATSSATFFRQIGGTLGVAILFSTLFSRLPDTILAAFGRTDILRPALDAALDPAVASAPQNAEIMDAVYGGIVDPLVLQLPAGTDLADEQVRSGVLDTLVPRVQDALSGTGGSPVGASLDGDTSFLTGADPRFTAPFLEGFATGAVTVYVVCLVVVLIAFVLSFFLKAPPLRTKSAIQEVADADAAIAAQLASDTPSAAVTEGAETKPVDAR